MNRGLDSSAYTARFYDIAWSEASSDHPQGVIAAALENGSLDLYDAAKVIANDR